MKYMIILVKHPVGYAAKDRALHCCMFTTIFVSLNDITIEYFRIFISPIALFVSLTEQLFLKS